MIGMIITGHIQFASGMRSALEAIAGEQKLTAFIDFTASMSTEQLEQQIREALPHCQQGDGVIIFTDIAGGSPWNRAMAVQADMADIRVISGSNLPMLINACLERDGLTLDALTNLVIETGHAAISQAQQNQPLSTAETNISDEL